MKSMNKRFKNGAASFYIVAFSTLILVILHIFLVESPKVEPGKYWWPSLVTVAII